VGPPGEVGRAGKAVALDLLERLIDAERGDAPA
jgi:hypothetical protein